MIKQHSNLKHFKVRISNFCATQIMICDKRRRPKFNEQEVGSLCANKRSVRIKGSNTVASDKIILRDRRTVHGRIIVSKGIRQLHII